MFKWDPFPFKRYSILFIIGILTFQLWPEGLWVYWPVIIPLWLLGFFCQKWLFNSPIISGLWGMIFLIYLGGLNTLLHDETRNPNHLTQVGFKDIRAFRGTISGYSNERENYLRYELRLDSVLYHKQSVSVSGKIYLYIEKEIGSIPDYMDQILVSGSINPISKPTNPNEFDYAHYLSSMQIYGQSFVNGSELEIIGRSQKNSVFGRALWLRSYVTGVIQYFIPGKDESQIALALILGVKDYLENDIKAAYSSAGAMHVLAVSGLHVGIIYFILVFLFKRLKRGFWGKILYGCLIFCGIRMYAMITGLSPSVMRAATMFSVIGLKEILKKDSNIYNSLGLAALILLVIDPFLIYSVGFQLSFIAVFGIVYFYPKCYGLCEFSNKILDKAWAITCISIAAQLSTFPLTLYYFHQFPTYFLLSNLIVIPGTTLILSVAFPFVFLSSIHSLALYLGEFLSILITGMNAAVFWTENLPFSLIERLYLDSYEVWMMYAILFLFFTGYEHRSFASLCSAVILTSIISVSITKRHHDGLTRKRMVVYHVRNELAIDFFQNGLANLYIQDTLAADLSELKYKVDPYRLAIGAPLAERNLDELDNIPSLLRSGPFSFFSWSGKNFMILDGNPAGYMITHSIAVDVLILTSNCVKQMNEIPEEIVFESVIISSDFKYYWAKNLKQEFQELGINVHSIPEDGYWALDLI